MMKHYNAATFGESFDKHPVLMHAETVEAAFAKQGYTVDLVGTLTPKPGSEPADAGIYLTPNLSDGLEKALDNIGWLSVNEEIAETFADTEGSTEISNLVVRNDLSTGEVVEMLANADYDPEGDDDTDMLTKVIHVAQLIGTESDPQATEVAAYDILRKSLGWLAEKFLARTDDFHKLLASKDQLGLDLGAVQDSPWNTDEFQLKTMQRVTSKSIHTDESIEIPHLSYTWTKSGIHVATMDERAGRDAQAKEMKQRAGVSSKTIMKKSEKVGETADYEHRARVVAWE